MGKPLVGKRKRGHVIRRQKEHEPKLIEDEKVTLLIRGKKSSQLGIDILRDFRTLKGPTAKLFSRKNDILPFENEAPLEFLCQKNDAGLFVLATHNKKRPHNLILGRTYDGHILDMYEFGVNTFEAFQDFMQKNGGMAKALGSATCVLFEGDLFEKDSRMTSLKSLLLDFFKGGRIEELDLASIDHCVVCSAFGDKISIRNYVVTFKKQKKDAEAIVNSAFGSKVPDIKLIEMGPYLELTLRRNKLPSSELSKLAHRVPKQTKGPKKEKNVNVDLVQGKVGRIHMEKQNLSKLVTRSRFSKAFKKSQTEAKE